MTTTTTTRLRRKRKRGAALLKSQSLEKPVNKRGLSVAPMAELLTRLEVPEKEGQTYARRFNAAIGCKSDEVAFAILAQVLQFEHPNDFPQDQDAFDAAFGRATAQLVELQPETSVQARLGAQMLGAHRMAMEFTRRVFLPGQTTEGCDLNVNRASRLMRLFIDQAAAMERLKGKNVQQRVVVERVDVSNGGQAIVGAITAGGGGKSGADSQ